MKQKNLYNVTVVGTFTKDILVWAEDEDAALDFAQSICDSTDLIRFEGDEPLDISAEDVEEIDPFDGFETGDGGNSGDADNATEDRGEASGIRIVGSANGGSATNGEETTHQRKVTEGCKCSGDACASCGKCGKPDAPNRAPSSAGKETETLRRLSELLGGPIVGILID
jgi:hypothetical protein